MTFHWLRPLKSIWKESGRCSPQGCAAEEWFCRPRDYWPAHMRVPLFSELPQPFLSTSPLSWHHRCYNGAGHPATAHWPHCAPALLYVVPTVSPLILRRALRSEWDSYPTFLMGKRWHSNSSNTLSKRWRLDSNPDSPAPGSILLTTTLLCFSRSLSF